MDEVKKMLHRQGIQIFMYLDDWLVTAESELLCTAHMTTVRDLCQRLGLIVNDVKSRFTPSQEFVFLGFSPRSSQLYVLPHGGAVREDSAVVSTSSGSARSHGLPVAGIVRTPGIHGEGGTLGKVAYQGVFVPISSMLGFRSIHTSPAGGDDARDGRRVSMVDTATQCSPRNSDSSTGTSAALRFSQTPRRTDGEDTAS